MKTFYIVLCEIQENASNITKERCLPVFSQYGLEINKTIFYFGELEIYYHQDDNYDGKLCFKREKQTGQIFFHDWGMDICFETKYDINGKPIEYGGILIRSLFKEFDSKGQIKEGTEICGPLSCLSAILQQCTLDKGKTQLSISLVALKKELENPVLIQTKRIIGVTNTDNEKNRPWRFIRQDLHDKIMARNDSDYYQKKIKPFHEEIT